MKRYILSALIISILISAPLSTTMAMYYAGDGGGSSNTNGLNIENPLGGTTDITSLVSKIIDFLIFDVAFPVAVLLVVYAGYLYMSSGGNEQKVKTAHKALIWALIGFAIVLIASSVPGIIKEVLYE